MYKSQAEAVREWLNAYRRDEDSIDEQLEEIRALRSRIMSIGAQEISDMPKAPSRAGDELAEYVIRLEALDARLSERMLMHERDRRAILDLIQRLKFRDEREIIKQRYLFALEWPEVMTAVYKYEEDFKAKPEAYRRKMFRAHEKALGEMGKLWGVK